MLGVMDSPKQSSMGEPKVDCRACFENSWEHTRTVAGVSTFAVTNFPYIKVSFADPHTLDET